MSLRTILLLPLLALTCQTATTAGIPSERPDHLEPLSPFRSGSYFTKVRSLLKLDAPSFLQMIVRPSFSPEYAVRLHGPDGDTAIDRTTKFLLTRATASTNISQATPSVIKDLRGNILSRTEAKEVTVLFTTAELSKPLAMRVYKVWQRMLERTRKPEMEINGLDGVTYEFRAGNTCGETWSPREGKSPFLLVELGESLFRYCIAPRERLPEAAKAIEEKAAKLEKYLDEHPR